MPSSIEAYERWLKDRHEMAEREALMKNDEFAAVRCATFLICLSKLQELTIPPARSSEDEG